MGVGQGHWGFAIREELAADEKKDYGALSRLVYETVTTAGRLLQSYQ